MRNENNDSFKVIDHIVTSSDAKLKMTRTLQNDYTKTRIKSKTWKNCQLCIL